MKIENYSILLASCAPVARLFLRAVVDHRSGQPGYYWTRSRSTDNNVELKRRAGNQWLDSTVTDWPDDETPGRWQPTERSESRISKAAPRDVEEGCVAVKTDIVVHMDDGQSVSSRGARLLPDVSSKENR